LGANIDGKKRAFMPYAGGFGNYRKYLDATAQNGYSGWCSRHDDGVAHCGQGSRTEVGGFKRPSTF